MIRRIAVLCIALLYLTATAGFGMNVHYCGTKVSSVSVGADTKACCKKTTSAAKPMKCCHDKNLKIKVSDQHKPAPETIKVQPTGLDIFLEAVDYFGPLNILRPKNDGASYRGPPSSRTASLVILNQNFRI